MRTFWRLLSFLRPYRAGVVASLVLAAAAIGFTVAIPYLTGPAINAVRRGAPAPRLHGGPPAGRRACVARRRVRPAPEDVRAPSAAGARLLRPPADGAADVASHGGPAGRAVLPRLRARVPAAVRPDPAARRGGDVRAQPRAGGGRTVAGALRRAGRRALRAPRAPRDS